MNKDIIYNPCINFKDIILREYSKLGEDFKLKKIDKSELKKQYKLSIKECANEIFDKLLK